MPKGKTSKKTQTNQINFKEDSKQGTGQPQVEDLEQIGKVVIQLQGKLSLLAQAQERLANLQLDITRLKTEEIPALLDQFNLSEVKLKDGSRVIVRPLIHASIPSEGAIHKCRDGTEANLMRNRLKKCFAFLRKNGAEALIKTLLKADFGKGAESKAQKAIDQLKKLGIQAEVTKGVHPQSLNAWVRERIEAGKIVDMELFKVFSGQIAEVTTPNLEKAI